MKRITIVIASIMIALSIVIILTAMSYPKSNNGVPGPGFFPTILASLVIVLGFALIISQLKTEDTPIKLFCRENALVFIVMGVVVLYLIAVYLAGFTIMTPIFLIVIMRLFKVKSWITTIAVSLGTTLITYIVFSKFLYVILPSGILF